MQFIRGLKTNAQHSSDFGCYCYDHTNIITIRLAHKYDNFNADITAETLKLGYIFEALSSSHIILMNILKTQIYDFNTISNCVDDRP